MQCLSGGRPICNSQADLDFVGGLKSVQLVEQLQHGPLHLRVPAPTAATAVTPGTTDAVHLIHENDAGGMLPARTNSLDMAGNCGMSFAQLLMLSILVLPNAVHLMS